MSRVFWILILLLVSLNAFSQDTILLINGKTIIASSVSVDDQDVVYRKTSDGSLKKIDQYKVFSIQHKDGTEQVIFSPDTLDPLDFKVEEMRMFIRGEQDAERLYKTYLVPAIGIAVGAASGTLAIYGLVPPALYGTVLGTFSPNVEKQLSFRVSGSAAEANGIKTGKHVNEVSSAGFNGFKKDQKLKINCKNFRFKEDTGLNNGVVLINSKFSCTRVQAAAVDGQLKLYKGSSSAYINDNSYREGYSKKVREKRIKNGLIFSFGAFIVSAVTLAVAN